MVFVWSPVTEFTNSTEWFTVPWTYPSVLRQSYDLQQSDIIFVPGRMNFLLLGWEWRSFGQELRSRIIFCSRVRCLQIPNSHPPFCLYGIYVSKFWLVNFNCFPWAIRDKFLAFFSEVKRIYTLATDPPPKRSASPDTLPNAFPLAGLALASPRTPLAAIQPLSVSVSVSETYCSVRSPDLFD